MASLAEAEAHMARPRFQLLTLQALMKISAHYGLPTQMITSATQGELAEAVAKHFAECVVDEEAVVSDFCSGLKSGALGRSSRGFGDFEACKRRRRNSTEFTPVAAARAADRTLLCLGLGFNSELAALPVPGEQVAARATGASDSPASSSDGFGDRGNGNNLYATGSGGSDGSDGAAGASNNGSDGGGGGGGGGGRDGDVEVEAEAEASWILAKVVRFSADGRSVEVQDEDDPDRIFSIDAQKGIVRLVDHAYDISKGDTVLAVFPDTTSFYRAVVHQVPKVASQGAIILVKFDGDEDLTGRVPVRPVPARLVLGLRQNNRTPRRRRPTPPMTPPPHQQQQLPRRNSFVAAGAVIAGMASALGGGGAAVAAGGQELAAAGAAALAAAAVRNGGGGYGGGYGGNGPSAPRKPAAGGGERAGGVANNGGGKTYGDMIAYALERLPRQRGNFHDICAIIEEEFSATLNWKLESDVRKTPVWKSSVRKILCSNLRFAPVDRDDNKQVGLFTFAR